MNKTGCDAAGCRWTEDYETKCNADSIYGVLEPFSSGYLVELIDADKVYCDSWINSLLSIFGVMLEGVFSTSFRSSTSSLVWLFAQIFLCLPLR